MERNVVDDNGNESTGDTIMAKGVSITYGDVAPGAKESFVYTATDKKFDTLDNLQRYNMQLYNYANPCEMYQTVLDGTATALPSDPNTANIGLWSEQISNDIGGFSPAIQLSLESEGQYSSQGFTFSFDTFNNIYPDKLRIQWIRDTGDTYTDLGTKEFRPDSSIYFCQNAVENFNKVNIIFISMNMSYSRLKVESIDFGYGTVFYGDELRNVKISQSIDPISSEIKINTCDFTLDSKTEMLYSFQSKQPLSVIFNDNIVATMFVKSSKRKAKFLWDISSEDYISILNSTTFVGGIYNNVMASDILETIFKVANVPYYIADELYEYPLSGYIPYTTCREALMQVCLASMAVVNTSNTDVVEVKRLTDDVTQTIPLERIMQGQSFEDGNIVTSVKLTAHTYATGRGGKENDAYIAEDSGTGDNIFVQFSEPLYNIKIGYIDEDDNDFYEDDSYGEILEYGANYAYINAREKCVLHGFGYKHTTQVFTKKNPVGLASETENVSSIESATLVSPNNANAVLEHCYDWLTMVDSTSCKILIGKDVEKTTHTPLWGELTWGSFKWNGNIVEEIVTDQSDVKLGDVIMASTEYLGDVTGRIIEESFNLNGNTIVKECVLK